MIINEAMDEYGRSKAIKDPKEKRAFGAVSDIMAEYGDRQPITGNRLTDKDIRAKYNAYIKDGNTDTLKSICKVLYNLSGQSELRFF